MKMLENEMNEKENPDIKDNPSMYNWTIIDVMGLLVLFQNERYRNRIEILLLNIINHPCGFSFQAFHSLIGQMKVESTFSDVSSEKNHSTFLGNENNIDMNLLVRERYGLIREMILRSFFEVSLWLFQIPCNKKFLTNYSIQNNENIFREKKLVAGISKVLSHLCFTQVLMQEEIVECLLSMSSLRFLQLGHHLQPIPKNVALVTEDISIKLNNGIRLIANASIDILAFIARKDPCLILPFSSSLLERVKMESAIEVPCAEGLDGEIARNDDSRSILMLCPQIIHRFCDMIIYFMDSSRVNDSNVESNERYQGFSGNIDAATILILVQKLLMNHDFQQSDTNKYFHPYTHERPSFRPISFSQRQAVGIILATHLIMSGPKPILNDADIQSLLASVTKIMIHHSKEKNSSNSKENSLSQNRHPLICLYGCDFFHSVANSSALSSDHNSLGHMKTLFRNIKNILSSLQLVKLASDVSKSHLTATESYLIYDKSQHYIHDFFYDTEMLLEKSQLYQKREMVFCVGDFLESDWWTSSWWHSSVWSPFLDSPSTVKRNSYCNLRQCQAAYVYKLIDTYLELGRRQSSNWIPDAWLSASIQIPEWPQSILNLFQSINKFLHIDESTCKLSHDLKEDNYSSCEVEEEYEFSDFDDSKSSETTSSFRELWSFEINVLESRIRQPPILDQSSTSTLLKIGWSCSIAMSACAAVLNNTFRDLSGTSISTSPTQRSNKERHMKSFALVQYQLSRFYDLKIRAELCSRFLKDYLKTNNAKRGQANHEKKGKQKRKDYISNMELLNAEDINESFDNEKSRPAKRHVCQPSVSFLLNFVQKLTFGLPQKYLCQLPYVFSLLIEQGDLGLKSEIFFLTNCISEQYETFFNTSALWSILANLSKNVYQKYFVRKEVSLWAEKTPENHQSIRNLIYLQISLINHLTHIIKFRNFGFIYKEAGFTKRDGEVSDSLNFHEASQGCASFHERDVRVNSCQNHLDSGSFPENFRCLEYIIHTMDVLASWQPVLRKREYESKACSNSDEFFQIPLFLTSSRVSEFLFSLYNLFLVLLEHGRDRMDTLNSIHMKSAHTPDPAASGLSPFFTHIIDVFAESIKEIDLNTLNHSSDKDIEEQNRVVSQRIEKILTYFQKQLIDYCQDASLAKQLLDILFLLTSRINIKRTQSITWKVLHTIYVDNPDVLTLDQNRQSDLRSGISRTPKAFSYFIQTQIDQNSSYPEIITALKSLRKIATTSTKRYEQCSNLRFFLLAYLSLLKPEESISQFENLFAVLEQVGDSTTAEIETKNTRRNTKSFVAPIPGLNDFSYPIFFEILIYVLLAFIAISSPKAQSSYTEKMVENPFKSIEELCLLFGKAISLFSQKLQGFTKQYFRSILRACFVLLKVLKHKVEKCFLWRSMQPVLTSEQKRNGRIDPASISFLQSLIDDVVRCTYSIIEFCCKMRREAQNQQVEVSDTFKRSDNIEEYNSKNTLGHKWAFAANVKSITLLDLRCEALIDNLRATCRNYNLIPLNMERPNKNFNETIIEPIFSSKKKRSIKTSDTKPTSQSTFSLDSSEKRQVHNISARWKHNNDRKYIKKKKTSIRSYQEVYSDDEDNTSGTFSDQNCSPRNESNISDSDSFGAIGDWGD